MYHERALSVSSYILSMRLTSLGPTPTERRLFHRASLQVVSKAALKNTNFQWIDIFISLFFFPKNLAHCQHNIRSAS